MSRLRSTVIPQSKIAALFRQQEERDITKHYQTSRQSSQISLPLVRWTQLCQTVHNWHRKGCHQAHKIRENAHWPVTTTKSYKILASHLGDLGKQCRPKSERGVWSRSTLFAYRKAIKNKIKIKKYTRHPLKWNIDSSAGLLKPVMVVKFNSHLSQFSEVGFYKIIYEKKAKRQKYEIILCGCWKNTFKILFFME